MGVGAGLSMYVVVVQKFTFAISSPDELLFLNSGSDLLTGNDTVPISMWRGRSVRALPSALYSFSQLARMTSDS